LFFGKIPLTLTALSKSRWIKLIPRLAVLHNHPLIDNVSLPIARQPKTPSNNTELALEELSTVMEVVLEVKLDSINMVNKIIRHQAVEILSWVVQNVQNRGFSQEQNRFGASTNSGMGGGGNIFRASGRRNLIYIM
jgi:hypothetical protein